MNPLVRPLVVPVNATDEGDPVKLHHIRRIAVLATAAALALAGSAVLASPASADAHGITFFGPKVCAPGKPKICEALGALHVVTTSRGGSGTDLVKMSGSFVYNYVINDFWLDNDVFDSNGHNVKHCQGPYHAGYSTQYGVSCTFSSGVFDAPVGSHHCATLWRGSSTGPRMAARACNLIS